MSTLSVHSAAQKRIISLICTFTADFDPAQLLDQLSLLRTLIEESPQLLDAKDAVSVYFILILKVLIVRVPPIRHSANCL